MSKLAPFPEIEDPVAEVALLEGPTPLVRRGLAVPTSPGLYVVASGDCVSHIGTSSGLRGRVRSLAALGTHRGSAEVLCAAYRTNAAPRVWWHESDVASARVLEGALKQRYGEPPWPRERYADCVNGRSLRCALVEAAGAESWEAGYVEAAFEIGEKLSLLFARRFDGVWAEVGIPPGPWAE
jgi:hypothetical protein